MPPKGSATNGDGGKVIDVKPADLKALCYLIMSCKDFDADHKSVAENMGIALAKSIPRKINSIVSPHGFEYKNGKIELMNKDTNGDAADGGNDGATRATPDADDAADEEVDPPTPAPKKRGRPKKAVDDAPKPGKKRKAEKAEKAGKLENVEKAKMEEDGEEVDEKADGQPATTGDGANQDE